MKMKITTLRYPSICRVCSSRIKSGSTVHYEVDFEGPNDRKKWSFFCCEKCLEEFQSDALNNKENEMEMTEAKHFPEKQIKDDIVIVGENGVPVTTSLKVAESFEKRHDNVIQKIKSLDCSDSFRALNFKVTHQTTKIGATTRTIPVYEMTRDGMSFIAMGFTGKKAAVFKERYIAAFNEMEKRLMEKQTAPAPTGINIDALTKILIASQNNTLSIVSKMMNEQEGRVAKLIDKAISEIPKSQKAVEHVPNNQEDESLSDILKGLDLDSHQDYFGPIAKKGEKRKIKNEAQQAPVDAKYYTTRSQIDFIEEHFTRMKCGKLPLPLVGKNLKRLSGEMKLPPNAIGEQNEHIGAYHENVIKRFKEIVERGYATLLTNNLGSYMKPVTLYKAV
jgi:Rha family phage regulatory protein